MSTVQPNFITTHKPVSYVVYFAVVIVAQRAVIEHNDMQQAIHDTHDIMKSMSTIFVVTVLINFDNPINANSGQDHSKTSPI